MNGARQLDLLRTSSRPEWVQRLKAGVARWVELGIYFGTSSWKYEGWLGQIYSADRYVAGAKFSQAKFERDCLAEYAEIFSFVCGDFSFYQFYSADYWRRLFEQVPPSFRFGFKAPEVITCPVFPRHERYGTQGGQRNAHFLDTELLNGEFLERLASHAGQVGFIVFEFPQFTSATADGNTRFLERLDEFLGRLPNAFRYGVEIRTAGLLGADYFDCLRRHKVAHVFNSWTRMPSIGEQLELGDDAFTADLVVARALLRPGRTYEEAVRIFEPYAEIRDPYPQGYRDLARLALLAAQKSPKACAYIAVNNRFVGNAPLAISEILEKLEKERERRPPAM